MASHRPTHSGVWISFFVLLASAMAAASSCGFPDYGGFMDTTSSSSASASSSSTGTGGAGGGGGAGGSGGCSSDKDCMAMPGTMVCDKTTSMCVECTPSDDTCPPGSYCGMDDKCKVGCKSDADCNMMAGDAGGGLTCDPTTHVCKGCTIDDQCPLGSICDVPSKNCVPGCTPTHNCQPGRTCCGSTCTDLSTDVDHCGSCQTPCDLPQATSKCVGGKCAIGQCDPGYQDCNVKPDDGCESSKNVDPQNCGSCGNKCPSLPNAQPGCSGGVCGLGPCDMGFANCDAAPQNGCEADIQNGVANCGACLNQCNLPNASPGCNMGACVVAQCFGGFTDCDMNPANGCEIATGSDPSNCGSCGFVCALNNAAAGCAAGKCTVQQCAPPYQDCNLQPGDGCEVNTNTSATDCGGCGKGCSLQNAQPKCSNGSCAIQSCNGTFADCNGQAGDGCEVDLNASTANCGACGNQCSNNNGAPSCTLGKCGITCSQGFDDCDKNVGNGCEINLNINVNNCGSCGHVCPNAGGQPACVNGGCTVSMCSPGRGDCDGIPGNGCEADLNNDPQNCGGCGLACSIANGTAGCVAGKCTVASCNAGFADCNSSAADGCEVNLHTLANCGGCGQVCALNHASASCATGTCVISSCTGTFANCDNMNGDGCEIDTSSSLQNCGACGNQCSNNHGAPSCSMGSCSIACAAGFGNCDNNVANGCETTTTNNVQACGSCGVICAVLNGTPTCNGTTCAIGSCTPPFLDCDGMYGTGCEINSSNSLTNCGGCGISCTNMHGSTSCQVGVCSPVCANGFKDCDSNKNNGCETDITSDINNCGGCGSVCSLPNANVACQSSSCTLVSCKPGFADCNLNAGDGCEIPLNTTSNCGACGNACTNAHGSTSCNGGACAPVCNPGFADCDGNPANGCETPLNTLTNCGGCGVSCSFPNAAASCATGSCVMGVCNGGFGDCDNNPANGCETDTTSSSANCGGCGNACPVGKICVNSACVMSCPIGLADCNMNPADGCEVNTTNDSTHCGNCNTACTTSQYCAASSCTACAAGQKDCDRAGANGCESTSATDASNCGSCGIVCSGSTNATGSCSGGVCGITCLSGYANCNGSNGDGCECGGNICCSGACEPAHFNGLGQSFDDCHALGVPGSQNTYTQTMAIEARAAWPFAGTDIDCQCPGSALCEYRQTATTCAVWMFSKANAGHVFLNMANNSCYCPTGTDPIWE